MINGELRSKIDSVWNSFWSGGVANPLSVIEQITYLLFIKRLDEIQTNAESQAQFTGKALSRTIFPEGKDGLETPLFRDGGCPYELMRWSRLKNESPDRMFEIVDAHIFPFLREMADDGTNLAHHMKKARFGIPTPRLLSSVVDGLDAIPMEKKDTKGDLYEYMLSKIASAGQNGQFRTPRHIIELMVNMIAPEPGQTICDPACGTAGFLVSAVEYMERVHPELWQDADLKKHFETDAFTGFDFDETMLRIGAMNMLLHGVDNPDIQYRDSLTEGAHDDEEFDIILANPPFAGSLDYDACSKDLQRIVKTKKTELLFLALFLRLMKTGGRAAVIVPDGVLFGSSNAHKALRELLVEQHKLDGIVNLPSGVFKPYAGVSCAILFFTKTDMGGTDHVWYYDLRADGKSLDDKRTDLLEEDLLGPLPQRGLSTEEHQKNNLPDCLARWAKRSGTEQKNPRTAQSFCVPKEDIVAAGYDLSFNRYREEEVEEVEYDPPELIIADLRNLEADITAGLDKLEEMLR